MSARSGPSASSTLDTGYRSVSVALIGASGFIGRCVGRALCARGALLNLIVRDRASAQPMLDRYEVRGRVIELDLLDASRVGETLRGLRPSITFNLAGYGIDPAERDAETAYRINAQLVQTIGESLTEVPDTSWSGRDLVHVGSALEYGAITGDLAEDSDPQPTTLYGQSKLAGTRRLERWCADYGLRGITARLFTVYGPGEHRGRLLPSLLRTARTSGPLPLTAGVQQRDFTYVGDVAEGLLRLGLATARPGEVVNLATGRLLTVRHFVETAAALLGIPADHLIFGALSTRPEEMSHGEVNLNRLRELVAWVPPTDVAEGVRRTWDFERSESAGRAAMAPRGAQLSVGPQIEAADS